MEKSIWKHRTLTVTREILGRKNGAHLRFTLQSRRNKNSGADTETDVWLDVTERASDRPTQLQSSNP